MTGMRIAVAGGTGVVGRHVVSALADAGHEPVVLARSRGVDVATGAGLTTALEGVGALVDVTNVPTIRRRTAVDFFQATTRTLLDAAAAAGVGHYVVLSIVGIDDVPSGYYAGKRRQEELALAGELPVSVLRATQFHEFPGQVLAQGPAGPLRFVPRMRVQPVAAAEAGAAVAELAAGAAVGRAPDLAGPEVHELPDLARRLLRARGERGAVVGLRLPGELGRQMRSGGLLPGAGTRRGAATFEQWLAAGERVPPVCHPAD